VSHTAPPPGPHLEVLLADELHHLQHSAVKEVVAVTVGKEGFHDGVQQAVLYDMPQVEVVLQRVFVNMNNSV